ncbi:xanthine dehydrogenase family protein molybdopterin-binding subunit [Oxalobacteraceae bacterium CAVE-383]|nr:xanthine dehydrogenase family protein molybdopterin-binding subunit [Oxalobacteraceae bacterium CAVE-383]
MPDDSSVHFGQARQRIDGRAKVTGAARYAADEQVADPAFAYLVTSAIACGRIRRMDLSQARAVPGVLDILTHENVGQQAAPPPQMDPTDKTTETLESDRIWHDGQIIAIVVADSFEAAREAANKVRVTYAQERPAATFDSPGATVEVRKETARWKDPKVGDFAGAFAAAPVKVDARYSTPTQHHNALELFSATCSWDGPRLTVYEPSQTMHGNKNNLAAQLKIDPAMIRCVSRYVGGAFGSKSLAAHTVWIAIAARRLGRPVKLVPTRDQGFTIRTYRAETRQHLQLGAGRDGRLIALRHEGWEVTSRPSHFNVSGAMSTTRMYACPNIETRVNLVHADRNSPGFMRAPPDTPYMFALESAMDELAVALDMDPIELRRINDTRTDPTNGKPFSSRSLMQCYDQAAERFGWSRRDPRPGSMRDGDWLIGWGCATACYPSNIGAAAVRLSLTAQGKATVALAAHEIGTGAYTLVAITAARGLGLKVEDITVLLGDSDLPPVPIAGGSNNAASTGHVTDMACKEACARMAAAAVAAGDSPFHGTDSAGLRLENGMLVGDRGAEPLAKALGRVTGGVLEIHSEFVPPGSAPTALQTLYKGVSAFVGGTGRQDVTAFAFGAQFVEIRIHRRTRELRAPRIVSAFASGTIVNATTARSQYMGGVIWGLSSALHEKTELDLRSARYVNDNFADYRIPVNADTPSVEIIMVPEQDTRVNSLGIKGIGEIGIVGMNAAVANAVYHATGKRVRDMPVRVEDLL